MKLKALHAISQALIDLGVDVLTNVPGYGGSHTFQAIHRNEYEKTADFIS